MDGGGSGRSSTDTEYAKRTCSGSCKRFRVPKPPTGGRYEAGQVRCQICDIWMDFKGCHLKDGSQATADSSGWFCNCCGYRVRTKPRNKMYKAKLGISNDMRAGREDGPSGDGIDVGYFNNNRASLLKRLAGFIPARRADFRQSDVVRALREYSMFGHNIRMEFNGSVEEIVDLAYSERPNKIALAVEFEQIRSALGRVPTRSDIEGHSRFGAAEYDGEFGSLEHLLERFGHDPWYRDDAAR